MEPPEAQQISQDSERIAVPARDWPPEQPSNPRRWRFFCCGRYCGCCPPTCLFLPILTIIGYILGFVAAIVFTIVFLAVYCLAGCLVCFYCCYGWSWNWQGPGSWVGFDLYVKTLYLFYQIKLMTWVVPSPTPEFMPIGKLKPKGPLKKLPISYALQISVPAPSETEFQPAPSAVTTFATELLPKLMPTDDDLTPFGLNENPVKYVMDNLGSVYPEIRDEWVDKQSDLALARFAFYGLGAHRLDTVTEDGTKYYVVRANQLSGLEVRGQFARYGGDAYFDEKGTPVKIVDDGFADGRSVVSHPGDDLWSHFKFRHRSSVSVLVTIVDHLYAVHLQVANITITAFREQLSAEHPLRRFLTPFSYNTILVNDEARSNLVAPNALGPRSFAFTDKAMSLAFASAPKLVMSGLEVSSSDGGPFLNRLKYYEYLKKRGIDTEYTRQAAMLYRIFFRFVDGYLKCYFPTDKALVSDPEMQAMFTQIKRDIELSVGKVILDPSSPSDPAAVAETWRHAISNFMWVVTAGHEHVGSVQAFVQDASFCAFKWLPGRNVGTKEAALCQTMLMSFTSVGMPQLMGSDWTYLFPRVPGAGSSLGSKPGNPLLVFSQFQIGLEQMARYCDDYDAKAGQRKCPDCFPLTAMNPRYLELSIAN